MFEFTYNKPFATIDGIVYEVYHFENGAPNTVVMYMRNDQYNWGTSAVENDTIINGVLQTSADMIIETLTNG
jgi:uncharacterized protein YaiE (UPF0345 family)